MEGSHEKTTEDGDIGWSDRALVNSEEKWSLMVRSVVTARWRFANNQLLLCVFPHTLLVNRIQNSEVI